MGGTHPRLTKGNHFGRRGEAGAMGGVGQVPPRLTPRAQCLAEVHSKNSCSSLRTCGQLPSRHYQDLTDQSRALSEQRRRRRRNRQRSSALGLTFPRMRAAPLDRSCENGMSLTNGPSCTSASSSSLSITDRGSGEGKSSCKCTIATAWRGYRLGTQAMVSTITPPRTTISH